MNPSIDEFIENSKNLSNSNLKLKHDDKLEGHNKNSKELNLKNIIKKQKTIIQTYTDRKNQVVEIFTKESEEK